MSGDNHSDKDTHQEGSFPKGENVSDQEAASAKTRLKIKDRASQPPEKNPSEAKTDPERTSDGTSRWNRFLSSVKKYDGFLLLVALILTVLISYHIDRKNRIDNDARAVHAMLDSALETTMDLEVLGSLRADDLDRIRKLSLLRYRVAAGPYRINAAESCVYTIVFHVDDFSVDTERESFLENGDRVAASERIFQRVTQLRKRIDKYSDYDRLYLSWLPTAKALFRNNCFYTL